MPTLHGKAFWPGVLRVKRCEYTVSHGIMPAVVHLEIAPQPGSPAMVGDLVMTDGFNTLILPRCKVDGNSGRRSTGGGTSVSLNILDRRWRWRDLAGIQGTYNQVDSDGKVSDWLKKTPYELCEILLKHLGETRYQILLPNVTVLPPVAWHFAPAAQALEALVNSLGCRVCYRLDTDSILIAPVGVGAELPTGHTSEQSLALDLPERPDRIIVVGQPVRHQGRLKLRPVGKEWNGEILPINELSYRPTVTQEPHIVTVTVGGTIVAGNVFTLTINDVVYQYTAVGASASTAATGLKQQIDLTPHLPWFAFTTAEEITITAGDGVPFDVFTESEGSATLTWKVTQQGVRAETDPWAFCPVHTMASVRGTDRLTKERAIAYAKESVFRWYQITIDDPSGLAEKVQIPGYDGRLVRREQIVLQQTRAEQITPSEIEEPVDEQGKPKALLDDQGRLKRQLFYDGHNRDMPAAVYGSYFIGTIARQNSDEASEVTAGFSIDPIRQLVVFDRPIYHLQGGYQRAAHLVLEVAYNIRDPDHNDLVCAQRLYELPLPHFQTPALHLIREDIQLTILGTYSDTHELLAWGSNNAQEAQDMADYYAQAFAAQYELTAAQTRAYAGLQPVYLDGAIAQVTFQVGEGSKTTVSRNSEHSRVIQRYPLRLQDAVLAPVARVPGKGGSNPPFQASSYSPGASGIVSLTAPGQETVAVPNFMKGWR